MSDVDTNGEKLRRRNKRWPAALKREIVAATYLPGASVSVVARQYDVNANQVFRWRRLSENSATPSSSSSLSGLVPVTIVPEPAREVATQSTMTLSDTIEIEVEGNWRVRVGSSFDDRALKRVLDVLRKRCSRFRRTCGCGSRSDAPICGAA